MIGATSRRKRICADTITSRRFDTIAPHPTSYVRISTMNTMSTVSTTSHVYGLDADVEDYPDDDDAYEAYLGSTPARHRAHSGGHRWRSIVVVGTIVIVFAVLITRIILNGGDATSTSATVAPPVSRTAIATSPVAPSSPSKTATPLPTVPTTTPSRTATAAPTLTMPPTTAPSALPAPVMVNPRTVVYAVTGTKQLIDLITVVYTDAQGIPQTDFNVALPWTKTIVLNPGVQTQSVVATSIRGRLNCAIVNAAGQTIVAATSNTIITTCTH